MFQKQCRPAVAHNPEVYKLQSYPLFDWLRFILASTVVMAHADLPGMPVHAPKTSVGVFFALSGWLIGSILLKTQPSELPRFFFNRATRIWLPYGAAIVLLYGIALLREGAGFFWLKYLMMDLTFTHQIFTFFPAAKFEMPLDGSGNQFWSLAVEEQFYLSAPLVMFFLPWGRTAGLWAILSALLLAIYPYFGTIALGVLAAVLQRDHNIAEKAWVRGLALVVALVLGIALFGPGDISVPPAGVGVFCVAVVLACARPGRRSVLGQFLGGLSFPLYLNHWLALALIHGVAKHLGLASSAWLPFVQYAAALVATVPLYLLVDRLVQQRRADWYNDRLGRILWVTAYALVGIGLIVGMLIHVYGPHAVQPVTG